MQFIHFLLFFFLSSSILGQNYDFNNYHTLQSSGEIPENFLEKTYKKIDRERVMENRTTLSKKQEKVFLESIHYGIDQILHSGDVMFGDLITVYINDIAKKLLVHEPNLAQKLEFYTLKSNSVNAFSTDQGIIFVTTGLLAKLENEAQLAYVLSHEIAHYTEKHVVNAFDVRNNRKNQIESLSAYSRKNELDADILGYKRYHEAGYKSEFVMGALDVLATSHIPLDNNKIGANDFSSTYFNTSDSIYKFEYYPIHADLAGADENSSHPNIMKRKKAILDVIDSVGLDLQTASYFGETRFNEIRKICQFESVRNYILTGNFIRSLYVSKILKRSNPESIYLDKMIAQSWYGIIQYVIDGKFHLLNNEELEGNIAWLYQFIETLDDKGVIALALRSIYDMDYKNNAHLNLLWAKMMYGLIEKRKFSLTKYSDLSLSEIEANIRDKNAKGVKLSKLEAKIKGVQKYYLCAIPDLIKDPEIAQLIIDIRARIKAEKDETQRVYGLSKRARKKYRTEQTSNVNNVLVLEPQIFSLNNKGVNLIKSEKMQELFFNSVKNSERYTTKPTIQIGRNALLNEGIQIIQDKSLLFSYFSQLSSVPTNNIVSVDYEDLIELKERRNADHCLLFLMSHEYTIKTPGRPLIIPIGISIAWPPTILGIWPYKVLAGFKTNVATILIDIENSKITVKNKEIYSGPVNENTLKSYLYDIYTSLGLLRK